MSLFDILKRVQDDKFVNLDLAWTLSYSGIISSHKKIRTNGAALYPPLLGLNDLMVIIVMKTQSVIIDNPTQKHKPLTIFTLRPP